MLRFVKRRKKAKLIIVLIIIILLLLSKVVKADGELANVYNIFGVEEIIVIEGDRPPEEEGNNRVFYSNESPRNEAFLNALKISSEELKNAYPTLDDEAFGYIDEYYNEGYIYRNLEIDSNYQTIEQFFKGMPSSADPTGSYPGIIAFCENNPDSVLIQILDDYGMQKVSKDPITDQAKLDELVSQAQEAPQIEETEEGGGILDFAGGLLSGIVSVFMYIIRLIPVTIANGIGKIISTIGALITGTDVVEGLTLDKILFNEVDITSIDFFSTSEDVAVSNLRTNVSIWYVAIRNLAVIGLAIVLVYIGIRMAISSVAEDKARYKKMLMNWVTSLVLLFVLHYIMVIIIGINNSLVEIIKLARATDASGHYVNTMNQFAAKSYDPTIDTITGIAYAFIYLLLSLMTLVFLITYIKRMITIAFLIIIAPIITVTYSIDKLGDGKSQALNAWLKEFAYNILIQVFHCIIYLALVQTSFNMLEMGPGVEVDDMVGNAVLAFVMVIFMYQAEDIVKNIFNFKASSMPQTIANAAIFATAVKAVGSSDKKSSSASSGDASKNKRKTNRFNSEQGDNSTGGNRQAGNANNNQNTNGNNNQNTNGNNNQNNTSQPNAGQNNNSQTQNQGNNTRRKILSAGTGIASALVKGTGYAVGFVAGAATGDLSVALAGAKGIGGATSNAMKNQKLKGKQRRIARAYNNFADMHPELDDKSRVEYSRMLLDGEIDPKNEKEREYVEALRDMNDSYEKAGMSSDDAGDQVEKVIKRVQKGEISETSAPERLYMSGKTKISDLAEKRRNKKNVNPTEYNMDYFKKVFGNNNQDNNS